MKILLDENLDIRLRAQLTMKNIFTVSEMHWSGVRNGELLWKMRQNDFSVLVTADKNIRYQQNEEKIREFKLTIIVLTYTNSLAEHIKRKNMIKSMLRKLKKPLGFILID